MTDYNRSVAAMRAGLADNPGVTDLVRFAILAPNGHNTQPWRFRVSPGQIEILPDFIRRTPEVDPDDHHLFASLGAAGETLALAAGARGHPGTLAFDAGGSGSLVYRFGAAPPSDLALFDAIPRRQSTRGLYDGNPVSTSDLRTLADAAAIPGVDLVLITDQPRRAALRDLVIAGNNAQLADAGFLRELKLWLRFSPAQAMQTGDGLFSAASGLPTLPAWLGPRLFDLAISATSEADRYARQIQSSAGLAVIVAARADPDHWVRAGRACQRFALQATALGLKCAFVNQPVEVASLRPELASLVGLPGRRPDIVMRFGTGAALPFALRRPVADVLI